ncbi:MAG: hypothetical protein NPMRTH1_1550014 [Nitrosopumilales archaeon]|nr:MAG: hypothetical protein NPMRTH1_1550014 [Nitrosopumilales archaeon]
MSGFDFIEALKEVQEMIPKTGYNICTLDDFSRPGEKLTLEDHVETEEQAKKLKEQLEKDGLKVYIYGAEGLEEGIENLYDPPASQAFSDVG